MTALTLTLHTAPPERLNLSALTPSKLAGTSTADLARIDLGTSARPIRLGDIFQVSGNLADGNLVISGGSSRLDEVGNGLDGGTLTIEGDVGHHAGRRMSAGRLTINGTARHHLASSMSGGTITVSGNVGDRLGAPAPGERDGMSGGAVVVTGSAGDLCGERQRRGLIVVKQTAGAYAGGRMLGGTIWALGGFGHGLGVQMRRGTVLTPNLENPLSTFTDCGHHTLGILAIMSRHYANELGSLCPTLPTGPVRRLTGDMASLGRGEILVTGSP